MWNGLWMSSGYNCLFGEDGCTWERERSCAIFAVTETTWPNWQTFYQWRLPYYKHRISCSIIYSDKTHPSECVDETGIISSGPSVVFCWALLTVTCCVYNELMTQQIKKQVIRPKHNKEQQEEPTLWPGLHYLHNLQTSQVSLSRQIVTGAHS